MAEFYLDNDVAIELSDLLQRRGHSARTVRDMSQGRGDDDAHLLLAAQRHWIFITHNLKDFRLLHDAWRRWTTAWDVSQEHAGILVIPQRPADEAAPHVGEFLSMDLPLTNELYEWRSAGGWRRRAPRR